LVETPPSQYAPPKKVTPSTPAAPPDTSAAATPHAVLRIVDANGNRATEGLRVVEDYLRFSLDDAHLAGQCKRLRHALADTLAPWLGDNLVLARDARSDVGRALKTPQELTRADPPAVVRANLKRIEQALRSLEEWTKLIYSPAAQNCEHLRYQVYELETAIVRTEFACDTLQDVHLCVLIDGGADDRDFQQRVIPLIEAGVPLIQLRDKRLDDQLLIQRALHLMELVQGSSARVVINDRPDVALAVHAHGVHLGQEDMPVPMARRLLGPHRLIGVSTHSIEQARRAVLEGASYLGVGPTFPSTTKTFEHFPGLDLIRAVAGEIRLPAFAIGGIGLQHLPEVVAAGLQRVAVSSAIWNAPANHESSRRFLDELAAAAASRSGNALPEETTR
jgi:thiamine-phosphate pyrophosphorylase